MNPKFGIFKKMNPEANPGNAIQVSAIAFPDTGVARETLSNYTLTVDVTTLGGSPAAINGVSLDGTDYTFTNAVDTTAADAEVISNLYAGMKESYEAHREAMLNADPKEQIFYGLELGLEISKDNNDLTVTQKNSQVVLDNLIDGASAAVDFTATEVTV